jgi:hypothetical protein
MDTAPWKVTIKMSSSDESYEISITYPKKLSIVGFKNLIHEKIKISPKNMKLTCTSNNEIVEESQQRDPLFLRDFPEITNESIIFVEVVS